MCLVNISASGLDSMVREGMSLIPSNFIQLRPQEAQKNRENYKKIKKNTFFLVLLTFFMCFLRFFYVFPPKQLPKMQLPKMPKKLLSVTYFKCFFHRFVKDWVKEIKQYSGLKIFRADLVFYCLLLVGV